MTKSKMSKNFFGAFLALVFCVSLLAGCTGNDDTTGGSEKQSQSADSAVSQSDANSNAEPEADGLVNKEGLPIVNDPVEYEIITLQMSTLRTANEKPVTVWAEEETGVKINWTEIPEASYDEKVNILFASDSLPDAICGKVHILSAFYNQLIDLNPYMDEYAPATTAFFAERPDYPQAYSGADGALKMLPIGDESLGNTVDTQLWLNQDWLTNLNLEMPKTTEEFEAVMKAFKEQDANGNGDPNDEIPFTFKDVWGWAKGIENFMGAFGVVENNQHVFLSPDDNKTVVFGAEEQGYYDFLKWMNNLYTQGLIDPEVFTHSDDQYYTKNSGKDVIGAYLEYLDGGLGSAVSSRDPEDQKFKFCEALTGPDGDQYVGLNNLVREAGLMITDKCENPEVLVRWYDWANTDLETFARFRWGAEGEVWQFAENEAGELVPQLIDLPLDSDYEQFGYQNGGEYAGAVCFSGWSPAMATDAKLALMPPEVDRDRKRPAAVIDVQHGINPLPQGIADPENEDQRSLIRADLDNYLLRFISDSIINGIDDAKWERHLGELEKLRVPEYKQLCQEFVDDIQSR